MTHDLQGIFDALLEGVLILDEKDRGELSAYQRRVFNFSLPI